MLDKQITRKKFNPQAVKKIRGVTINVFLYTDRTLDEKSITNSHQQN